MTMAMAVSVAMMVIMGMAVGVRRVTRTYPNILLKLLHSPSVECPGVSPGSLEAGMRQHFDNSLQVFFSSLR